MDQKEGNKMNPRHNKEEIQKAINIMQQMIIDSLDSGQTVELSRSRSGVKMYVSKKRHVVFDLHHKE